MSRVLWKGKKTVRSHTETGQCSSPRDSCVCLCVNTRSRLSLSPSTLIHGCETDRWIEERNQMLNQTNKTGANERSRDTKAVVFSVYGKVDRFGYLRRTSITDVATGQVAYLIAITERGRSKSCTDANLPVPSSIQ
ncbi:hypothetical protein J6590_063939 [Homalodisca vitripennis]|nr:hypothetical protein J6590_063939 [Homalodisca vitripennis]